jgi:hypothetical protein
VSPLDDRSIQIAIAWLGAATLAVALVGVVIAYQQLQFMKSA